ncbi:GNAT family N-acetyltransferase [Paenibacillus abyssi]|uniref:N-acetyltransferase n=1 Tax=Paenibacillus abyssi TaxID=1340531 RepID=A0A917FZG4_9BACL|nr:GNAT family N-acetyltransferase [Paenibacillus abyssi]GGG15206.1 N-acetyltransferase [Paenibacillus abyssi]
MYQYRQMNIEDYEQLIELWQQIEGLGLSEADSKESIAYYLQRNPGMSFVCVDNEKIVGTILSGHDGRRGFIYHMAVAPGYRGRKIANTLVSQCLSRLKQERIMKCHLMVLADNEAGQQFWSKLGWMKRDTILLYSSNT